MNQNEIYCAELIVSKVATRGTGKDRSSLMRRITQVFTKDGELIAENDPSPETYALFDLINFHQYCLDNKIDKAYPKDVTAWLESITNKS